MTRRQAVVMLGFSPAFLRKSEGKEMDVFKEMFEWSQKEGKGLTFWVSGQTVGGGVVKFNADTVEIKSQQYRRVIIKISAIEAVAMM